MDNLRKKFQQLTEREQVLAIVSAIVVVIGLFYWIIWAPLNSALESNRVAVEKKQTDLAWVRNNANKAIQLRESSGTVKTFTGSLPQAVNSTAARLNIAISRMQPQGNELKVWVDQAPFNDVLSWLKALEEAGIRIIDVDVAQADASGLIKVRSLKIGAS